MNLKQKIDARSASVAVVGLGYVGLPLALAASGAGFRVTAVDIDGERVGAINSGISYLLEVASDDVKARVTGGRLTATADYGAAAECEVVAICVPTPLEQGLPDMSFIESAAKEIARVLRPGSLVILESTTYPGTTDEFLRQILESSGLRAGSDFFLGFSPERIDPANPAYGISNVPKIVGGIDEMSTDLMKAFYGAFVDRVVTVSSARAAEMTKLLENTYRHVNIALANEIAILCHDLGIDVWEVIDAAATKPFGFQPFYPGPGWGGHCIPVDPAYLSWRVQQMGETARFVELALEMNRRMPAYVVQRIADALEEEGKTLKGSSVFVLGVAYKADVADTRESPALEIIPRLREAGAHVSYHDPHVERVDIAGTVLERSELTDEALSSADLVVVLTNHSAYDWRRIGEQSRLVFDTRDALRGAGGRVIRL